MGAHSHLWSYKLMFAVFTWTLDLLHLCSGQASPHCPTVEFLVRLTNKIEAGIHFMAVFRNLLVMSQTGGMATCFGFHRSLFVAPSWGFFFPWLVSTNHDRWNVATVSPCVHVTCVVMLTAVCVCARVCVTCVVMLGAVSEVWFIFEYELWEREAFGHLNRSIRLPLKDQVIHGVTNWKSKPHDKGFEVGNTVSIRALIILWHGDILAIILLQQ